MREAAMTICPGQEQQQGRRFRAIMEKAAEKLDRLVIVNAAGLSYHNFKRLIPGDIRHEGAQALARIRAANWLTMNKSHIDGTMGSRCRIIDMEEITADETFRERSELIRTIHESGPNEVSAWFDYSTDIDINERGPRLSERNGIILKPDMIAANALDYLCDEIRHAFPDVAAPWP